MSGRPLLVWTLAFAAGIALAAMHRLTPGPALCLAALGAAALTAKRWPALMPVGLLLLGASAGVLRLAAFEVLAPTDVSRLADGPTPVTLSGTLASDPEARPGGRTTFFFQTDRAETRRGSASVSGEVWVTLGPDAARRVSLDYGDRMTLTGLLTTPEPATNPGAFSWREYLARRAVYAEMRVKRPGAAAVLPGSRPGLWMGLAWQVRKSAMRAIDSSLPPQVAAVLSGIMIGRRADLSAGLLADFVHTGTVHILASAGLHVGILAFWLERGLQKLTLPRKAQAALLMALLILYALVCGGRPAVVRAVLMAALYFGAVLFEREPDAPTAAGAAALVILAGQPTALLEPGFQLSFLTVGTLAVTMPVWNGFWHPKLARLGPPRVAKALEWVVDGFGLSLLAQLGAMPVTASAYSEVSLTGWAANALVVPLLFVLIPLAVAGVLVWTVSHVLGAWLLTAAGGGVGVIVRVVSWLGERPGSFFALPPPPVPLLILFYAFVYGGTEYARRVLAQAADTPPPAAGSAAAGRGGVDGARTTP